MMPEPMRNEVFHILALFKSTDVDVFEGERETLILGEGFIIAVDHAGNTTSASVGEWETGYTA